MKDYLDTAKSSSPASTQRLREEVLKYWSGTAKYSFVGRVALEEMGRMAKSAFPDRRWRKP
jgi:hypothetical protein